MRPIKPHILHPSRPVVQLLLVGLMLPLLAAGCYGPEEKKRRFFEKGRTLQAAGKKIAKVTANSIMQMINISPSPRHR